MRSGDRVRLIPVIVLGTFAPMLLLGLLSLASGRFPLWWALPVGLACGGIAAWAVLTFFGVAHLERMAAKAVHGGRHYYFGHDEIRVLFDDDDRAWLRLADIRVCLGGDGRGVRHFAPAELTLIAGEGAKPYLSIDGVRRYIKTSRHPDRQRFVLWFEREFVAPLEKRRERHLPMQSTGSGAP